MEKSKTILNTSLPISLLVWFGLFSACSQGPEPIRLSKDNCAYCRMGIAEKKFATEFVSSKGRVFKFDDLHCMKAYANEAKPKDGVYYVSDAHSQQLIPATKAWYVTSENIKSPMSGHTLGFEKEQEANEMAKHYAVKVNTWEAIQR